MNDDVKFDISVLFGMVKLDSYFTVQDGELIGMGRATHYDKDGNITKVDDEPTGIKITFS